jgi:hypothetical protein
MADGSYRTHHFFTVAVGLNVSDAFTGMMAWLALKLASNWHSQDVYEYERPEYKVDYAITALLAGLISMFFCLDWRNDYTKGNSLVH